MARLSRAGRCEVSDGRGRLEAEHGVDTIARQRSDPLGTGPELARGHGPASFRHAGEAPRRLSEQVVAEIEDVDPQHHQVFAPATPVFFAPPAELEHLADRSRGDQRLDPLVPRAVAGLEGHGELDVRPLAGIDDRVTRGQVRRQRLLAEDAQDPVLGTRQDHVLVPVEPPRRDHDKPRLLASSIVR